jgi:glycosyltransferase involved in cell wall biosynthesis
MPLISVLTPAHAGRAEYLTEAGRSLREQEMPSGWTLEWIVQEDGPGEDLKPAVEGFDFVHYDTNGEKLGIATTRNLALSRARGEYVFVLDSDDMLLPRALAIAIKAFETHPEIHWVSAQAYDLMPDGTRVEFEPLITPGYVEVGVVGDYRAATGRYAFHQGGMMLRTAITRAVGGWVASPRAEDGAFLAAVAALTPGWFTPETIWLVRMHPGKTTSQPYWENKLFQASQLMCDQRAAAIREVGMRLAPTQPHGGS